MDHLTKINQLRGYLRDVLEAAVGSPDEYGRRLEYFGFTREAIALIQSEAAKYIEPEGTQPGRNEHGRVRLQGTTPMPSLDSFSPVGDRVYRTQQATIREMTPEEEARFKALAQESATSGVLTVQEAAKPGLAKVSDLIAAGRPAHVVAPLVSESAATQPQYRADVQEVVERPLTGSNLPHGEPIKVTYKNYRGEVAERTIIPVRLWYGSTPYHPENGWLLEAFDVMKGANRDFALKDMQFANLTDPNVVNEALLGAVAALAALRNAEAPGPVFRAYNEAMAAVEDIRTRYAASRKG